MAENPSEYWPFLELLFSYPIHQDNLWQDRLFSVTQP
jgi:hypothetical protein